MNVKDGSYAITEQGDLGLGLTPVSESVINTNHEDDDNNSGEHTKKSNLFQVD